MFTRKLFLLIQVVVIFSISANSQTVQVNVSEQKSSKDFPLVELDETATIYIDSSDFKVVSISANHFAEDIELVTSLKPRISTSEKVLEEYAVIVGTLGFNNLIDQLVEDNKLDVKAIQNKWESFIIATVENPFPNVKKALVIVGSDRRATAFGLFSLSESIGISPWYWWADITPKKQKELFVDSGVHIQKSPSVKYRGIFINDEGFGGLNIWAKKTFDTEVGDIGPKTYAKVFELLLRLKANYCWPAMHECTKPFYYYPDNPVVADDYAIVIGTSHCEQMHCNTMTEWNVEEQGQWNYKVNKDSINSFWTKRVDKTHKYENIYTLGMRGSEDIEMEGAETVPEMVKITQESISNQREILSGSISKKIETIPQVLCTYKEVLVTYQNGLDVPDDVTLLWADDNHGYIRQLCNPEEQKRSGGSGVYYHLSLLGTPEGFLWLNTISPSLIAYEMTKAYNYGADRIWMINIGDIKPHEKELSFTMEMAWDINRWTPENADEFIEQWSAKTFGKETAKDIAALMDSYYILSAAGKPEHTYRIDYSINELNNRIEEYRKLVSSTLEIKKRIPENLQSAYYELIEYPILGCKWMNECDLLARRSLLKASQGDVEALKDAENAKKAYAQLQEITDYYNKINADGKWNHIMNWHPFSWGRMPKVASPDLIAKVKNSPLPLSLKLQDAKLKSPLVLESNILKNKGNHKNDGSYYAKLDWNSEKAGKTSLWIFATIPTTHTPSIKISLNDSVKTTTLKHIGNIWHTQSAAAVWYNLGEYNINKGDNTLQLALPDSLLDISQIHLGYYPPAKSNIKYQIAAKEFLKKKNGSFSKIQVIKGLGLGSGVSIMPFTAKPISLENIKDASWVEYEINVPKGNSNIEIHTLPTQRIYQGQGVRFAASIEEEDPILFDIQADEFTTEWQDNVLKGYASKIINYNSIKSKKITVRVYLLNPGVVIRDIILK